MTIVQHSFEHYTMISRSVKSYAMFRTLQYIVHKISRLFLAFKIEFSRRQLRWILQNFAVFLFIFAGISQISVDYRDPSNFAETSLRV